MMTENPIKKIILSTFIACILCIFLVACTNTAPTAETSVVPETSHTSATEVAEHPEPQTDPEDREVTIRVITTSDLHGKMLPWEYALDTASGSGSLAQAASAIKEYRNENTVLMDIGDMFQGNSSNLFFDEPIHPMILGINRIGYDVAAIGNHEFNYGMDITNQYIRTQKARVVISNVYDPDGNRLADPYTILERSGIKIAVIGVITPNILHWDKSNLEGYQVTDPVDEVNAAIREIGDKADVIVVAAHMSSDDELNEKHSGAASIAELCPGVDLICAAHGHQAYAGTIGQDVPVTENKNDGCTISVSDIHLLRESDAWKIADVSSEIVLTESYAPDSEITALLEPYHNRAREDLNTVIGRLEGGPLVDSADAETSGDSAEAPAAIRKSTRLISFFNEITKYYSNVDIAASPLYRSVADIEEGAIRKRDISNIYPYENSVYILKMNGGQLKKWMEWAAAQYHQTSPDNPVVSIKETYRLYNLDIFSGVNYEVNLYKPAGERIENLTWPDGRPVKDDDEFTVGTSNYRVNTALLQPGIIYDKEEDFPELLDNHSVHSSKTIYDLIVDYIVNVKQGTINPVNENNWKITGH